MPKKTTATAAELAAGEIARLGGGGLTWYDGLSWLPPGSATPADVDDAYEIVFDAMIQNGRDAGMRDPRVRHGGNGHYAVVDAAAHHETSPADRRPAGDTTKRSDKMSDRTSDQGDQGDEVDTEPRARTARPTDDRRPPVRLIWEWAVPLLAMLLASGLVELGHLSRVSWRWVVVAASWALIWLIYAATWQRWRAAEIDRIRRTRLPIGQAPHVTLIVGQDLCTGQIAVVNDRGFVVEPERDPARPLPPTVSPARVGGRWSAPDDARIDRDDEWGP